MLVKRIITALVLIPLVISGIFFLPPLSFTVIVGVILSLALWEWANITGITGYWPRFLYIAILWGLYWLNTFISPMLLTYIAVGCWIVAAGLVIAYAKGRKKDINRVFYRIFGILLFVGCWTGLSFLHFMNAKLLLLLLLIIWGADIGAYFVGCKFGKHKLAERVSPKKTVEGFIGGIVAVLLVTGVFCLYMQTPLVMGLKLLIIALLTAIFATFGDLFESMLKRQAQVKDSGNLLPGHGGMLDRLDSMLAAVPIFVLGIVLLRI